MGLGLAGVSDAQLFYAGLSLLFPLHACFRACVGAPPFYCQHLTLKAVPLVPAKALRALHTPGMYKTLFAAFVFVLAAAASRPHSHALRLLAAFSFVPLSLIDIQNTTTMASSFGTKVSVISCTEVSA